MEIAGEELGDVTWMCGDRFDQFYRRLEIYPVTQFGSLAVWQPYQTPDGIMEGDSAGLTVYQTCAAVWTACGPKVGSVSF